MPDPNAPAAAAEEAHDPSMQLRLIVGWLFVGIPLVWGVWQVVVKTFDLFTK